MLGLYIHIPFCRKRCHYCDFNKRAVSTIYFGGGTPTYLKACFQNFSVSEEAEISIEANPEGLSEKKLRALRKAGFECRHNKIYWKNGDYLGLGAGAHAHLNQSQFNNSYSITGYIDDIKKINKNQCQCEPKAEALSKAKGKQSIEDEMAETNKKTYQIGAFKARNG